MARNNYTELTEIVKKQLIEHHRHAVFSIATIQKMEGMESLPYNAFSNIITRLMNKHLIVKLAKGKRVDGGTGMNLYQLAKQLPSDCEEPSSTKKTSADFQRDARERIEYMNQCQLRLAKALGLPCRPAYQLRAEERKAA